MAKQNIFQDKRFQIILLIAVSVVIIGFATNWFGLGKEYKTGGKIKSSNNPFARKTCLCPSGLETISWWQNLWGGCAGHSAGGGICIDY